MLSKAHKAIINNFESKMQDLILDLINNYEEMSFENILSCFYSSLKDYETKIMTFEKYLRLKGLSLRIEDLNILDFKELIFEDVLRLIYHFKDNDIIQRFTLSNNEILTDEDFIRICYYF